MVVVADTSVLLNLCRVQLVDLLPSLFGEVWIPPMVEHEFRPVLESLVTLPSGGAASLAASAACPLLI